MTPCFFIVTLSEYLITLIQIERGISMETEKQLPKKEKQLPKYAKFLTECREKMCMRQRDLAEMLNTQYQIVSRWERGLNRPSFESARKLAEVFGEAPYKFREE